jgi:signal transduction histidine kinase
MSVATETAADTGTALVVHDLKNELGALEGVLWRLAQAPQPAAAAAAHRQCVHLRQRLVMFLTLYGGGAGLRAHCEDESPAELLDAVRARHDEAAADPASARRVQVVPTGREPAFCYLDRRLVELALDAAMHNALRFARRRVWLSAAQEGAELILAVEDDGPGPDPSRPPDAGATGLGTTLCRAVARVHGQRAADGGVRLAARAGGGARFELRLPT